MFFYNEPDPNILLVLSTNSSSLSFSNAYIGDTEQKTFIVSAISGNTIETVTLTDNTGEYSFFPSLFTLSATSSQLVTVTFEPTSWGVKTGEITIASSGGSTKTVALSGVCIANPLIITSSVGNINFGNGYIQEIASASFTVSAGGAVQDIVLLSDNSDQFDFFPTSFSMNGANQAQNITVYFTPTSSGSKVGILTLSASGGDVAHVSLMGSGIFRPLILTSSVASIDFGTGFINENSSSTFTVSAGGIGGTETVAVSDNSNQFSFSPSSFSLTGGGASQFVTATFSPTSEGVKTAVLTLSASGGSLTNVNLQGLAAFRPISASGGTTNDINISNTIYRIHTFTSNGQLNFNSGGTVDYLVVGGGAAGGTGYLGSGPQGSGFYIGNGGNAGQMLTGSTTVVAQNYPIRVGALSTGTGNSSSFSTITASGGAFRGSNFSPTSGIGASGLTNGLQSSINGTATFYAGGGGAGGGSPGGAGGGGSGGINWSGNPGLSNTGGGGGGGQRDNSGFSKAGGEGGSGIVIVRYPLRESQITSLLLRGDGADNSTNIIDSSANNLAVTRNGDVRISTVQSKFGGSSIAFDGNADWLTLPSNQVFSFGTGNFTVEGWVYLNGNQNLGAIFVSSTTGAGNSLHIQINNTNRIRITNQTTQFLLATNAIPLATWTHIAVVRNGSTLSIYQNGVLNGSVANSTNFIENGAVIGIEPVGGPLYFNGFIDDFRVIKSIARYTSNFTPPGAL